MNMRGILLAFLAVSILLILYGCISSGSPKPLIQQNQATSVGSQVSIPDEMKKCATFSTDDEKNACYTALAQATGTSGPCGQVFSYRGSAYGNPQYECAVSVASKYGNPNLCKGSGLDESDVKDCISEVSKTTR